MKYFFTLSLIIQCIITSAQENSIKGKVIGKNIDKSFINIVNTTTYKATISNAYGEFTIQANVGDSILVNSLQYKEVKFMVKKEYFKDTLEVKLEFLVNKLQDVNVYSIGLSGDLQQDAQNIKTYDFNQTQLGLPAYREYFTREERRLYSAMSSQSGLPLDYIFNLINGTINRYKDLVKYERLNKNKNKLLLLFPKKYYTQDLYIPKELVEDFAYHSIEKEAKITGLIKEKNKLKLLELLPKLAEDYIKMKESEKDKTQTIDE